MELEKFKKRMWKFIWILKKSSKDWLEVRIHWERSFKEKQKRLKYWIPFDKEYFDLLKDISNKYDIQLDL